MCEQDKVVIKVRYFILAINVLVLAIKGLGIGNKHFQHNIVDLFPGTLTVQINEAFTVNGRTHTDTPKD